MVVILWTLVQIYRTLGSGLSGTNATEKVIVEFPFSLYTAWITVATIANISALQSSYGWNDVFITEIGWTWLKLAFAGAIGASVITQRKDIVYLLVIAWATYGIYTKQAATPEVAGAAATLSILALLLGAYHYAAVRKEFFGGEYV